MQPEESTQQLPGGCLAHSGMYNKVLNLSVVTCNLGMWNLRHKLKPPRKTCPPHPGARDQQTVLLISQAKPSISICDDCRKPSEPGRQLSVMKQGQIKQLNEILFWKYGKSLRHFKHLNTYTGPK